MEEEEEEKDCWMAMIGKMIPRSQPRTLAIFALLRFFFLLTAFTLDLTAAEPAAAADDNYQMPQRKARRPLVGKNDDSFWHLFPKQI